MENRKKALNFLWEATKPFKWLLILNSILVSIAAIMFCAQPYIIKVILDKIANFNTNRAINTLIKPITLYLLLELTVEIIYRSNDIIWLNIRPNLVKKLTIKMMDKMLAHSHQLYKNNLTGNISNRVKDVIAYTPEVIETIIDNFLNILLTIIASIITLSHIQNTFGRYSIM